MPSTGSDDGDDRQHPDARTPSDVAVGPVDGQRVRLRARRCTQAVAEHPRQREDHEQRA